MSDNYDSIDNALNVESSIVKPEKVSSELDRVKPKGPDIEKDYEYTRANLYSLIEKGQEASMESWNLLVKVEVPEHMKLLVN